MPDLTPIPTDTGTDPERLRRLLAISGGMSVTPQPGVPPQPTALRPVGQPDAAGWRHPVDLASEAAASKPTNAPTPRTPEEINTAALAMPSPKVERLSPVGGEAIPPSDATRLQPIGRTEIQALPTTSPGVPAGSSADLQGRLQKLQYKDENPWGSEYNHPGFLGKLAHVAAKVGNIAGDVVAPNVMARVPGTELNRVMQEKNLQAELGQAQTRESAQETEKTREKHEENVADVNQQKADLAIEKAEEAKNKDLSQREIGLRKLGLKTGPDGKTVPLDRSDMSDTEQAALDLKQAQSDSASAHAALDQIKADPNSPQNKAILERIQVMAKNAATAAGKLGLDKKKFVADYFGLDEQGNPIPGTTTDEKTGQPIGPRIAHAAVANAPGAERLKRSDLAQNVIQNSDDMRRMIRDNPNLFGKVAGRVTSVQQMLGSDDPEISRLGVAMHNIALASNGAHGLRSAEAVKETEDRILNHFRNGPEATLAAVDEIDKSVQSFIEAAKHGKQPMPSPGETPTTPAKTGGPKAGDVEGGFRFKGGDPSKQENWVKQ